MTHGWRRVAGSIWLGAICALQVGCGSVSRGEYRTLQTQNRVLSEQNRAQEAELANLREHQRKLEDRLIQADRQAPARVAGAQSGAAR